MMEKFINALSLLEKVGGAVALIAGAGKKAASMFVE